VPSGFWPRSVTLPDAREEEGETLEMVPDVVTEV
jgi:hypothetical protein